MHPTYQALVDAGMAIAERGGLGEMSVNAVVAEAGVAKGTFYVHFADRTTYLVALHHWFHDQLAARISEATAALPLGAARLHRGAVAYLDGCLQGRAVKAMLVDMRGERAITDEIARRNALFAVIAAADFQAMNWAQPEACARLYVAMAAEAALVELEAGGADVATRKALAMFVGLG